MTGIIVLVAYNDYFREAHGHLEAVFVFNEYDILSLESGNFSATDFT